MPRLLMALIAIVALHVACGDEDGAGNPPTGEPSGSTAPQRPGALIKHYMRLGEARQLLADMGLEGISLAPDRYRCSQSDCPDEPPGDDSNGCLSLLPTGDPANAESLLPDDPPRWWSATWHGAFDENYAAPPEPVVNEPKAEPEPGEDLVCGADFSQRMTAADAAEFLSEAGLGEDWELNPPSPERTCPPRAYCPIPGAPADATGCLDIGIGEMPVSPADPSAATVTVYVNFGFEEEVEATAFYHVGRPLADVESTLQQGEHEECVGVWARHPTDPYGWVPYTEVIQPTYWVLVEPAGGKSLLLRVAVGGSCEEFERVEIEETDESVTINAFIRHAEPGPSSGCDLSLKWHATTVQLDEPLGDRPLLGCAPEEIWYRDHDTDCKQTESA